MTPIERKRKELEDDVDAVACDCGQKTFEMNRLEMFNLGVQMGKNEARKEIFIKLNQLDMIEVFKRAYENRKTSWEAVGIIREWRNATDEIIMELIRTLKQSLEGKK